MIRQEIVPKNQYPNELAILKLSHTSRHICYCHFNSSSLLDTPIQFLKPPITPHKQVSREEGDPYACTVPPLLHSLAFLYFESSTVSSDATDEGRNFKKGALKLK